MNFSSLPKRRPQVLRAVLGVAAGAAVAHSRRRDSPSGPNTSSRRCGSGTDRLTKRSCRSFLGLRDSRATGTRRRACRRCGPCSRRRSAGSSRTSGEREPRAAPARRRRGRASGCRGTAAHAGGRGRSRGSARPSRRRRALFGSFARRASRDRLGRGRSRPGRCAAGCAPGRRARSARRTAASAASRSGGKGDASHLRYFLSRTRRSSSSLPGSRIASTWSPAWSSVSSRRRSRPGRPRMTEISRDPLGQLEAGDALAGATASSCRSAPRRSRGSPCAARAGGSSSCSGTSCSMRAMIALRRADRRRDPEQVEVRLVARVVDARDHLRDAVLLPGDLADDHVVLVVAGDRDDEVRRARDAGPLEHEDLGRVADAAPGARTPPRATSKRSRRCSMSVTSWPMPRSVRATFAPTLPPPAMRTYIRTRPPERARA